MDGNGRWAQKRGLLRESGHLAGVRSFRKFINYLQNSKIKYFTFFAFSTENWGRPQHEVAVLMKILKNQLENSIKKIGKNSKINFIGERNKLPQEIINLIIKAEDISKNNIGLNLNFAINYGGRHEILNATKNIAKKICEKKVKIEEITENFFSKFLYTKDQPDPDLIIRTSGENRISNFLIWQSAYSEFITLDTLWPDFTFKDFEFAISEFSKRKRNFGKI
jgi:undecaprenyl diphosphate synthase